MAELPTLDELYAEKSGLKEISDNNSRTLSDYQNIALAQVKRDLEDIRDILWSRVYDSTNSIYYTDADGNARNEDRIKKLINLATIASVYEDYAVRVEDSGFWDLHVAYHEKYMRLMTVAKIDVDRNDDGTIDEAEEEIGQTFLRR